MFDDKVGDNQSYKVKSVQTNFEDNPPTNELNNPVNPVRSSDYLIPLQINYLPSN
jgi:hypothetical protein